MWKRSRVYEDDIPFLESITDYVKEKMRDVREPCHVMIDSAARKRSEKSTTTTAFLREEERRALIGLCERYVDMFEKKAGILSVRILVSPKGCEAQQYHLDYKRDSQFDCRTLFVALTPSTPENCTEYLEFKNEHDEFLFQKRVDKCSDASGMTTIPVTNVRKKCLIVKPHDIVFMNTSKIPHRRGPTFHSTFTRIVLNIDITPHIKELSKFEDTDYLDSLSNGCIASQKVVDDLHSEIVIQVLPSSSSSENHSTTVVVASPTQSRL